MASSGGHSQLDSQKREEGFSGVAITGNRKHAGGDPSPLILTLSVTHFVDINL